MKEKLQKWEIFTKKYKDFKSTKTLNEYISIIKLIENKKLTIKSKSRYKQVKSVLKLCQEANIKINYSVPDKYKNESRGLKVVQGKIITPEELEKILSAIPKTQKGRELKLAIEISYYSGLRLSEVLSLTTDDITYNGSLKLTVMGKGRKERDTFLPPRDFKEKMEKFKNFTIDIHYVESTFRRVTRKLGIKTTFHGLRHSYATRLLNGRVKLNKIQKLLGHANLNTTAIYLHCTEEVDENMRALGY